MANSNSAIGHASWSENESSVGSPGDSTGKEVCTRTWYAFYTAVLRPPNESLAAASAQAMEEACANPAIGYSQGTKANGFADRKTLWTEASKAGYSVHKDKLVTNCNCDCASLVDVCICIGSRMCDDVDDLSYAGFNTKGAEAALKKLGYTNVTSIVGTTSPDLLQRGDVLIRPKSKDAGGHTAMVLLNGSKIDNPEYGMEGCTTSLDSVAYTMGSLYEEQVERQDATLKEIAYLDSEFEPSITPSNIKLSVINYTNLLGELFVQFIPDSIRKLQQSGGTYNYDGVKNGNAKAILRLLSKYEGMTLGGAIGIIANMHYESSFRADAKGDKDENTGAYTSFGLCQWHLGRGDKMKAHCLEYNGVRWDNNLDGQVDYLVSEDLMKDYKSTWEVVSSALNTVESAKEVAHYFCIYFEVPEDSYNEANRRAYGIDDDLKQNVVEYYWNQIVLVPGSEKEV